jgi:hypothetical protein
MTFSPPGALVKMGCALLVTALLMVVISIGLLWYGLLVGAEISVNLYYHGGDLNVIKAYLDHFMTMENLKTWGIIVSILLGITISSPMIAYFESGRFLDWLKHRS